MVVTYAWTLHDKLWSTAGESFGDTLFGESCLGGIGTGAAEEAPGGGTRKGGSNAPVQEANPMETWNANGMSALVLREFKRIDGTSEHIRSQAEMMLQVLCIERGDTVMTMTPTLEPPSSTTRHNVLL
jgi:hypothetical protein